MRRAATLIFAILAAVGNVAAQEMPDLSPSQDASTAYGDGRHSVDEPRIFDARFDSIARNPAEYSKLLDKFKAAIVRMSVRDCAIVYYGFPMQDGFSPDVPAEGDMQRAIMAEDYEAAYALGVGILEHAPVNLTALYWTLYAATEIREPWEVRNSLLGRYNSISYIISLSGDGISPPSALKVVWDGDMYTYAMFELGLDVGEGFLWDGRWTEFEVTSSVPGAGFKNPSIFFELWSEK